MELLGGLDPLATDFFCSYLKGRFVSMTSCQDENFKGNSGKESSIEPPTNYVTILVGHSYWEMLNLGKAFGNLN